MANSVETIWKDILAHVRMNHPAVVRGWFCDLSVLGLLGGVITIGAVNEAQRQYLERHCREAFAEGAQAATGRLISVAFEVSAQEPGAEPALVPSLHGCPATALTPDYTLDQFVAGPCNRLAHAAAVAVAEAPGRVYNPLFIHGPSGVGKTHLLQAICHALRGNDPNARFAYLSGEAFVNQFVEALEQSAVHSFRDRYRGTDVLVVDDVQFLSERERSQDEFFHTFNALHQAQRQVVLSADRPPGDIPHLEERLTTRFGSGLVAMIDRPCVETRMAILRKKAALRCIELTDEVTGFIASRVTTNTRGLEGALLKLDALSQLRSCPITPHLAAEALGVRTDLPVKIPTIIEAVANRFGVKVSDLQGKRRSKDITHPRQVCMYLARQLTTQSLEEIGGYFGGRDHTTVLHASRLVGQMAKHDTEFRGLLDEISRKVKNSP
jgi:chromosomal replication initiator protein